MEEHLQHVLYINYRCAVTDPKSRVIRPGLQGMVPRTAEEMVSYFAKSTYGQLNRTSIDSYYKRCVNKPEFKVAYDANATSEHARQAPHGQSYVLSIPMQVRAVMGRRWQILKGDRVTQIAQIGSVFHHTYFLRFVETDLH